MERKNLDEGASPLLIIHILIQHLLLLQTMIPNSQLIFLPSAKRGLRKNQSIGKAIVKHNDIFPDC